jgi:uncharacterized protein (DUF433 family)
MKEYGKYIISDPRVCRGKLIFRDTEIPVEEVLDQVADGMNWEEIIEDWEGLINYQAIAEAIRLATEALNDQMKQRIMN